jgi:hypothetical protein
LCQNHTIAISYQKESCRLFLLQPNCHYIWSRI